MQHPTPPPLPKKHEHKRARRKGSALFSSSLAIFLAGSAASYMLVAVAGVNVPRYYPTLREFSYEVVPDVLSMSLYGRMLYALIGGLAVTIVHILLRPLLAQVKLVKLRYLTVLAYSVVWLTISWIIVEAWHDWGIQERGLDTTLPINDELYLAVIGLVTLFAGVLLTSAAVKRMAALSGSVGLTGSVNKSATGAQKNGRSAGM